MSAQPSRKWVYTQSVKGRFQRIHRWSGILLQAIFFVTPWISFGGHPAVRVDLPARRLYAFGSVFTAHETLYLVLLALFATFALFFFTALFGRMWCGYACPQTVFLEEWIRPIERWIEGERSARMRRDKGPLTLDRVWRKAAKWTAFAAISVLVGTSFVAWFSGAREIWTGQAGPFAYGTVLFLSATMFFDFAWFREQFCNYLCPYARFQGALTDDDSLVIAYKTEIGEPRREGGACIDCNKCVVVCPQGIDIRNGFQLECISCARCIDACDEVMGKKGLPGLVQYVPLHKSSWVRPRTVAYGALLMGISAAFFALLANRHDIDVTVNRAPGSLYVVDADGWLRNTFLLKVVNKDLHTGEEAYTVTVEGLPAEAQVNVPPLTLKPSQSATVPLIVRIPPTRSGGRTLPITVNVASHDDRVAVSTTFKSDG